MDTPHKRRERLAQSAQQYETMVATPANLGQQLALDRTHLAVARTFLAWLRTSLAVMGAAVAIVHADPARFALVGAGLGVVALLFLGWALWDVRGWSRVLPTSSVSALPVGPYAVGGLVVAVVFILALLEPMLR